MINLDIATVLVRMIYHISNILKIIRNCTFFSQTIVLRSKGGLLVGCYRVMMTKSTSQILKNIGISVLQDEFFFVSTPPPPDQSVHHARTHFGEESVFVSMGGANSRLKRDVFFVQNPRKGYVFQTWVRAWHTLSRVCVGWFEWDGLVASWRQDICKHHDDLCRSVLIRNAST